MMLLDYFGFLVGFLEKGTKSANLGKIRGLTPWRRDPTQQHKSTLWHGREGGLDKARVFVKAWTVHAMAKLRCNVALFTDMCFCHVLLFRYSEDLPIGLMKTL